MENNKRCIFHIPNKLDEKSLSGSQVRPRMMIQAFKDIGYDVDVVMGYGKERKKSINIIKNNIKSGIKYDFLYSESSTMPTLLTEKNHLPLYPNLDFGFFKFCKNHGIKIGLFYRDMHWKFPVYNKQVNGIKKFFAKISYRYDLLKYKSLVDKFYLPSNKLSKYINSKKLESLTDILLPGSSYSENFTISKHNFYKNRLDNYDEKLRIFYVGGIFGNYNFIDFVKMVSKFDNILLTICCRKSEWEKYSHLYRDYLNDNIKVIHKSGLELEDYYMKTDLCLAYFKDNDYMKLAVPIKVFEYIGHVCPIICSDNIAISESIKESNIGWVIDYNDINLNNLLKDLLLNYKDIYNKHINCIDFLKENTWSSRASKVAKDLSR